MIPAHKWYSRALVFMMIGALALTHVSCQTACRKMEPTITCPLQTCRITSLPSSFSPLSQEERKEEWGKELLLGDAFAREWDLYRAITCYKRALILIPEQLCARRLQLEYNILLSYYLGNKYREALTVFEESPLSHSGPEFPAFNNLLLIVYDCYFLTKQEDKADCVLEAIRLYSPDTTEDIILYEGLKSGELDQVPCLISQHREAAELKKDFDYYYLNAKSPKKARTLNAILPGAGYYYVGEKKSAVTSFIINALFTAAAYQFFSRGYPAAGAITTSLEMGWYLGGINGAGIEAEEFNTRLYEGVSRNILMKNNAFPVLMFETSF